jgi:hypothetical protein
MTTIADWIGQRGQMKAWKSGKFAAVVAVRPDENPDTRVKDPNVGELFLKEVSETYEVNENTKIFMIEKRQWEKITCKNLYVAKPNPNIGYAPNMPPTNQ